jgi:hypothetical protein
MMGKDSKGAGHRIFVGTLILDCRERRPRQNLKHCIRQSEILISRILQLLVRTTAPTQSRFDFPETVNIVNLHLFLYVSAIEPCVGDEVLHSEHVT